MSHIGNSSVELDLLVDTKDQSFCTVNLLRKYLKMTAHLRRDITNVFIASRRPFRKVTLNNIMERRIHSLKYAGIDASIFKAHSLSAVSSSAQWPRGYR